MNDIRAKYFQKITKSKFWGRFDLAFLTIEFVLKAFQCIKWLVNEYTQDHQKVKSGDLLFEDKIGKVFFAKIHKFYAISLNCMSPRLSGILSTYLRILENHFLMIFLLQFHLPDKSSKYTFREYLRS